MKSGGTLLTIALALLVGPGAAEETGPTIAITSVTLIDGTGARPRPDTTVIVQNGVISDIRPATGDEFPSGTVVIDGNGRYLLPGFIDSNVHATVYGNSKRRETVVKYGHRNRELALEFLQRQLKHGCRMRENHERRLSAGSVLLQANPLDDIGNIRRIERVIARGHVVDIERLPERPLFSIRAPTARIGRDRTAGGPPPKAGR